jgi:hypothetical protein
MPNDISQYISIVGGGHANSVGGVLRITPNPGPPPFTGTIPLPPRLLFDVAQWNLTESFAESPLAKSGMLGATSSRRCGYVYNFDFDVILDLRVQPELSLRSIAGAEIFFRLGSPFATIPSQQFGNGIVKHKYYWCPIAKLTAITPAVNANGKQMVRQHIAGTASSHILILTQGDDVDDATTTPGAYAVFLENNPNG